MPSFMFLGLRLYFLKFETNKLYVGGHYRGGNGSDSALTTSIFIFSKRIRMRIRMLSDTNADRMLLEYGYISDVYSIRNGYE